ncbi:MAG: hypothetical protein IM638_13905 [Bacteroidetes bacterium]|nr:hypothetical protein [Bacteroidota bacterium]
MKLLYILTTGVLITTTSLHAQRVKTTDHIITGSAAGSIRNAFDAPSRLLYVAVQTEYQWRFSERFSVGLIGMAGMGKFGLYDRQWTYKISPEVRYWLPVKSTRLQPFIYANYGFMSGGREIYGSGYTQNTHGGAAGIGMIGWLNDSWGVQAKYDVISTSANGAGFNAASPRLQMGIVFRPGQRKKSSEQEPK